MIDAQNKPLHLQPDFLLSVESWENDGDNYRTTHKWFASLEEAELVAGIVKLFAKQNGNEQDLNNFVVDEFTKEQINYVTDGDLLEDDDLVDTFSDFAHSYLGGSEWYSCRVYEKHVIRKIPVEMVLDVVSKGYRHD